MTQLDDRAMSRLSEIARESLPEHSRYRFAEIIGRGGMGTVYRAEDRLLGRDVAIKVLRDERAAASVSARLAQEAKILARLDHPGLMPVHDAGELDDGRAFYVMRLVRGTRLDEYLAATRSLTERLRVFLRVLDPVAFAHSHGILHRDLKPANIMVGPYGEVLVLDWGIAKVRGAPPEPSVAAAASDAGDTGPGTVLGTAGFMAPEQAAGDSQSADERADVYALGAILETLIESADRPAPKALAAIVARAKAVDPRARYPSVVELGSDLTRFLDGESVSAYRESPVERVGRFIARHRTAATLIVVYIIVRIVLLLVD